MFATLKLLNNIKDKLNTTTITNNNTQIITISSNIIDIFYKNVDLIKKFNYNQLLLNTDKFFTKNNQFNTLEAEKKIAQSSVSKIGYYQKILMMDSQQQTIKSEMISEIDKFKIKIDTLKNNFKDTSKVDILKRLITNEYKQPGEILTTAIKSGKRVLNKPTIIVGDFSLKNPTLNVSISSNPAIQWSCWQLTNAQNYFSITDCYWTLKGKKQTLKFKSYNKPDLILLTLTNSYELTLSIYSIPPNLEIHLICESTDDFPFKKVLETSVSIPSITINEIITED